MLNNINPCVYVLGTVMSCGNIVFSSTAVQYCTIYSYYANAHCKICSIQEWQARSHLSEGLPLHIQMGRTWWQQNVYWKFPCSLLMFSLLSLKDFKGGKTTPWIFGWHHSQLKKTQVKQSKSPTRCKHRCPHVTWTHVFFFFATFNFLVLRPTGGSDHRFV